MAHFQFTTAKAMMATAVNDRDIATAKLALGLLVGIVASAVDNEIESAKIFSHGVAVTRIDSMETLANRAAWVIRKFPKD